MSGFVEKTVAEQGFAASWDLRVRPLVEAGTHRRHRRLLFGGLVTGLASGLGFAALFLARVVAEDSLLAQPFFLALVLALGVLAAIASRVTTLRRDTSAQEAVMAAVESHFAALFTADENNAFAEVILQDLVSDGVLDPADHEVRSHHAGSYRGCRIRLISARARRQNAKRQKRAEHAAGHAAGHATGRVAQHDLVIARISLPVKVDDRIYIDTDRSRLAGGDYPYHVDHDLFDHIFGMTCSDRMAAARLVTTQLAENLLMVRQRLADPLNSKASAGVRVAVQIADGSMRLIIQESPQNDDSRGRHITGAEHLARRLLMRFATIPGLVDELHGDAVSPPAFASLAPAERSGPQIAL